MLACMFMCYLLEAQLVYSKQPFVLNTKLLEMSWDMV